MKSPFVDAVFWWELLSAAVAHCDCDLCGERPLCLLVDATEVFFLDGASRSRGFSTNARRGGA